jgi:hypothetical protein
VIQSPVADLLIPAHSLIGGLGLTDAAIRFSGG